LFSVNGAEVTLKEWLRYEWERTGMPLMKTNEACGVANAATRKYFTKDHLWYAPPPEVFEKLVAYANKHGHRKDGPYFSVDGDKALGKSDYEKLFPKFYGKYGITNVWDHPPLHNGERIRVNGSTKYAHLNQKPLKLITMLLEVSSTPGDTIWEPFGGLCTAGLASYLTNRKAFCAEIDEKVFKVVIERFRKHSDNLFAGNGHQDSTVTEQANAARTAG
jgi:site-specific DNA-methyltransferase (adenine-specific)